MSSGHLQPVLFLLNSLTIGGSERKAVRIVNELHRRGYDVHVAYLNGPSTLLSNLEQGVSATNLGRRGKVSLAAGRALARLIEEKRIAQVICINLYPMVYALMACRVLRRADRPKVVLTINTTDHLHAKDRLSMLVYRPLMMYVDQIVFGCRTQLDSWCMRYLVDREKCRVIYNGVDAAMFSPDAENTNREVPVADKGGGSFIIGTVGQLRSVKNQYELIVALAQLRTRVPNARLVIVGDGSERARLEKAVREFGLTDRVRFSGQVDNVRPTLESLDVFVLPSISETFSNAALEAMSMGKPVILSNTGGAQEMIQDGVNGYIYEQGAITTLVALLELLALSPDAKDAIGRNARETVLEYFSFDRMVFEYVQMLR